MKDILKQQLRIAFIGAGNMARCMISGLLLQGYDSQYIAVSARHQTSLSRLLDVLSKQFPEQQSLTVNTDNSQLVKQADVVVLAVKPAVIKEVLEQLCTQGALQHQPLLVSLAAGVTIAQILEYLKCQVYPVIRGMPNTPTQLGAGMTGLYAQTLVNRQLCHWIADLFQLLGEVVWVEHEQQLDIITAISGSGPAYFFYIAEVLERIAIEQGLSDQQARQLTIQTMLGAVQMLRQPQFSPAQLRQQVSSPGGTTEQAINVLQRNGLYAMFNQAVTAAIQRAASFNQL